MSLLPHYPVLFSDPTFFIMDHEKLKKFAAIEGKLTVKYNKWLNDDKHQELLQAVNKDPELELIVQSVFTQGYIIGWMDKQQQYRKSIFNIFNVKESEDLDDDRTT